MIRSAAALIGDGAIRMQTAQSAGVRIEGELAPGHRGIGAIEIASAFSLARTGSISIQLSGTEAGSQHDLLTVLGTSILEGTIVVELLPSDEGAFAPAQGDAFDILIAQAIQNAGVAFDLPALDTGLGWETGIVADGGVARLRLLVVPEPGSATLLLFGLGLLTRSSARPGVCARSRSR